MNDLLIDFFWIVSAVLIAVCAICNAVIQLKVLFRRKFTFSCEFYFTEYIIPIYLILTVLSNKIPYEYLTLVFAASIILWCILYLRRKAKKITYIRVFGIKRQMHGKLEAYLAESATHNRASRADMYIYGGDSKTPCNLVIFRNTPKSVYKPILNDINSFLRQYSYGYKSAHIITLLLDAAAMCVLLQQLPQIF